MELGGVHCPWTNQHMNHKFQNFKIRISETFDGVVCNLKNNNIIILITTEMVKVLRYLAQIKSSHLNLSKQVTLNQLFEKKTNHDQFQFDHG